VAILVCPLVLGLWLVIGAVALPAASAGPFGSLCRPSSQVDGIIRNDTNQTLRQVSAEKGITNVWCQFPPKEIAPHSSGSFEAADLVFESEVRTVYRADNGDVINFFAASRFFGRPEGSCSVSQGSQFKCHAVISHNDRDRGNNTDARFNLTP
jgi:hypothetical protein